MRVIIPANEENMQGGICPSFGRAPIFIIWDTENDQVEYVKNPGFTSSGGAGIKAAQAVVDQRAEAVLTPRMGGNAADVLKAANIKILKTNSDNVKDNMQLMKDDKLVALTDIHPGFHLHGNA